MERPETVITANLLALKPTFLETRDFQGNFLQD